MLAGVCAHSSCGVRGRCSAYALHMHCWVLYVSFQNWSAKTSLGAGCSASSEVTVLCGFQAPREASLILLCQPPDTNRWALHLRAPSTPVFFLHPPNLLVYWPLLQAQYKRRGPLPKCWLTASRPKRWTHSPPSQQPWLPTTSFLCRWVPCTGACHCFYGYPGMHHCTSLHCTVIPPVP